MLLVTDARKRVQYAADQCERNIKLDLFRKGVIFELMYNPALINDLASSASV